MHLLRVHVRFFRSFNYDLARKSHPDARPQSWEMIDGTWWPFITVELDRLMTAIVGANESGKSQLITALQQVLTGEGVNRLDFCRYSPLFSVQRDRVRTPDLGIDVVLDSDDAKALRDAGWTVRAHQTITFLRLGDGRACRVDDGDAVDLKPDEVAALERLLPQPLVLPKDVPLPDRVLFSELLQEDITWAQTRKDRAQQRDTMAQVPSATVEGITQVAGVLAESLTPYGGDEEHAASVALARTLIFDLCEVAESTFTDLLTAHDETRAGQLGALERDINRLLALRLNFALWWRQDRDFALKVKAHSDELVFTVADRTGAEYSFEERSTGLRFFLGYFVRLQARTRIQSGPNLLLMDEPDAFLSSLAQADLLRVLAHFAAPGGRPADQVVYVTHSPFLLDRNHPERIRVLDKGTDQDGTRVVADAVRNHYEPLRSSLGTAAAETAFLGGSNLIVEGTADQVLLAGVTTILRSHRAATSQLLDLNEVTIVPAGGASQVPYTAYLARGRDELKPACVALLDGDKPGKDASAQLRRGVDGLRKRIIDDEFIVDLGEWADTSDLNAASQENSPRELEDLVPPSVAIAAAAGYALRLLSIDDAADRLRRDDLDTARGDHDGLFDALQAVFASAFDGATVGKIGFAKEVVRILAAPADGLKRDSEHCLADLGKLIAHLAAKLTRAEEVEGDRRRDRKADVLVRNFLRDHESGDALRDEADTLLHNIENTLEGSKGDEVVAQRLAQLRRKHKLGEAVLEPVEDFEAFSLALSGLKTIRREAYG